MKVLVTGGAGYIGSHTVKMLVENGFNVVVIDNLVNGNEKLISKKAKFYKCDLKDKEKVKEILLNEQIENVIHFAAFADARESMEVPEKYFENNVSNTISLLNAMFETNVKNIVFSSSSAVYGEPKYVPMDEKHPKKPVSVYGLTKLIAEQILEQYNKIHGFNFVSLRYFNAAGADESGKIGEMHKKETRIIPLILKVAKGELKQIKIFGDDFDTEDGTAVRDYVHVNDLAKAHILAMQKINELKNEYINLGSAKGYSILDIINTCEKITNKKIKRKIVSKKQGDPSKTFADYKKSEKLLGWKPERDIKKIIETAWKWHKKLK